jgi:2-polyprenyl-6-methoxyphenol hydroxylase-like FAD-dependent oxidoreductase
MTALEEPTPAYPVVSTVISTSMQNLERLHSSKLTALNLGQESTEMLLRRRLFERFGLTVEFGTELLDFEQSADQVTAHLCTIKTEGSESTEETVTVQYLVGTDGGRSVVRKKLGVSFIGETRTDTLIYGDVVINGLDKDV